MTKGELIEFLQPFSDDIRVMCDTVEGCGYVSDANPEYIVVTKENRDQFSSITTPELGEGVVVL